MSDVLIQSLITACLTLGLAVVGAYKLNAIAKTSNATHDLVNSASLVQLKLYAVAARRLAGLTNEEADIDAAKQAEKLVAEHTAKQAAVDAKAK